MSLDRVGVVGTGLIGTSVALALRRRGRQVLLVDQSADRAAAAAALGAGTASTWEALAGCDHVVVAVPPAATTAAVTRAAGITVEATISDVCSVKTHIVAEIETLNPPLSRFCGGHPIAGSERGGPGAARAGLFDHAVWAVTPTSASSTASVSDAVELAELCGARAVTVSPDDHDRVLAALSHAPQAVASALATELATAGPLGPQLAGPGFRDTTRLADGDPVLWGQILVANSAAFAAVADRVAARLSALAAAARSGDVEATAAAIAAGNQARTLLPGKPHAPAPQAWSTVGVVLADRPGELARLLAAAAALEVNVEDLAIEHAPEHPVGYVSLFVRAEASDTLVAGLRSAGWVASL